MILKTIPLIIILLLTINSCKKEGANSSVSDFDKEILDVVNNHRISVGLQKLEFNQVLWEKAKQHSSNMASGVVSFGHDGFYDRVEIIKEELEGAGSSAENVAYGVSTAQTVLNLWLNSSGHKTNIEGDYNLSAVSAVKNESGTWYFTQIFYKK